MPRFGLTLVVMGLASVVGGAKLLGLPRYKFEVGQEITFSSTSERKHDQGSMRYRTDWTVWVVSGRADTGWHLVVRKAEAVTRIDEKGQSEKWREDAYLTQCDIMSDGRVSDDPGPNDRVRLMSLLPRLPGDEGETKKGWTTRYDRLAETVTCRLLPDTADSGLVFEAVQETMLDVMYGLTAKDIVTFDSERGLPVLVKSEATASYGRESKTLGTTKLDSVVKRDAEWMRQFRADAERFFAADTAARQAIEGGRKAVEEVKAGRDKGQELLEAARKDATLELFRKQLDARLKRHESDAKSYLEDAEDRAALIGQPAADFETTDLDGMKHALKDYRGKVLVLDFWYRGCGWCVRAMPQVKQVAEHFKGKPVVVLGMNIDEKDENARFVIDKMKLNYGNLKASGLQKGFHVSAYPTLLIIDQEGKVRGVHIGYSATLKDTVVAEVGDLLAK